MPEADTVLFNIEMYVLWCFHYVLTQYIIGWRKSSSEVDLVHISEIMFLYKMPCDCFLDICFVCCVVTWCVTSPGVGLH
jgi:hypothetical protein